MALQYLGSITLGVLSLPAGTQETERCGGVTPQGEVTHSDGQGGRRQINSLTSLSSRQSPPAIPHLQEHLEARRSSLGGQPPGAGGEQCRSVERGPQERARVKSCPAC